MRFLEPTLTPKHPKSPHTHGGWSCGKLPPLRQVPQSWNREAEELGMGKGGGHSQIPLRQPSFRRPVCPEAAVGKEQAWAPTEFRGPREALLRAPVSTSGKRTGSGWGRATKGIEGRLPRDGLIQLDDLGQVILPPCLGFLPCKTRLTQQLLGGVARRVNKIQRNGLWHVGHAQ